MGKGYELIASSDEEEVKVEPKAPGGFPGVVSFYHSDEQRKGYYGTEDSIKIPKFGFDTYIPKLYGKKDEVKEKYIKSDKIVSGYEATDDTGSKVPVCVYPQTKELVYDTNAVLGSIPEGQAFEYYCSWLNPVESSMELFAFVHYPKDQILPSDDFIKHKAAETENKDIEKIHFKLVKVTSEWKPIINDFVYVDIKEVLPLTEEQQAKRDQLVSKKEEVKKLQTAIDGLEEKEKEIKDAIPTLAKENKLTYLNYKGTDSKELNEKTVLNDLINFPYDEGEVMKVIEVQGYIYDMYNRRVRINNKNFSAKIEKEKTDLKKIRDKADLVVNEKNALSANKIILRNKKVEIEKIEAEIADEDSNREIDDTLSISGKDFLDFKFETAADDERKITIKLENKGENKRAALIAYYKRKDKIKSVKDNVETEKEVERENIIGQINILASDYYKNIKTGEQYVNDATIKMHFNPMPIHFVKVNIRKRNQNNDGTFEEGTVLPWGDQPNGGDYGGIVKKINEYFHQAGIKFRMIKNPIATELEVSLIKFKNKSEINNAYVNNKKALWVAGKGFLVDSNNYIDKTDYKKDIGVETFEGKLLSQLKVLFKRHLMNEILYDRKNADNLLKDKDVWRQCYTLPDGKSIPPSRKYREFLDIFPDLCPKKEELSVFSKKKVDDWKLIWDRANGIAEYLMGNINLIFLINNIPGEGTPSKHTAAYAHKGFNSVVMFGSGIKEWEDTLPHELGHTLGLQHTFHASCPMFPDKVSFNTNANDWKKKCIFKKDDKNNNDDSEAYAATYYNITDYKSDPTDSDDKKNDKFTRTLFAKWQWETMLQNIKIKSYKATISGGHSIGFSQNNPYLNDSDEDKNKLVDELNKILS